MERVFGLIGQTLTHSFSKKYFSEKFEKEGLIDCRYELFPLEVIAHFPALLQAESKLVGLNVTIPYKTDVIPYLTRLSPAAAEIGAVNTIHLEGEDRIGYNTDVIGFEQSLLPLLVEGRAYQALVFGTGGAAKAVRYVLKKLNIPFRFVSRQPTPEQLGYEALDVDLIREHPLLINTTPLGMYPREEAAPDLPYEGITKDHLLFDLVYNPEKTLFLKRGERQGAAVKNGLEMLRLQAEAAWDIWNPNP